MFSYQFAQNALIGILLITPLLGLYSTVVVSNKMAFFADGLGHSAFTGIAIGLILNLPYSMAILVVFSIIFALLMVYIRQRNNAHMDSVIGVLSSTAIAIGLIIMSRGGGFSKYSNFLIGDLIAIGQSELKIIAIILIAATLAFCLLFNSLILGGIGSNWTLNKKISAKTAEIYFAIILAVVVAVSIRWVGILLINSLLVLPAATSRLIAKNAKQYVWLSILFSILAGIIGLVASLYWNTSAGATICLILAFLYFILSFFRKNN